MRHFLKRPRLSCEVCTDLRPHVVVVAPTLRAAAAVESSRAAFLALAAESRPPPRPLQHRGCSASGIDIHICLQPGLAAWGPILKGTPDRVSEGFSTRFAKQGSSRKLAHALPNLVHAWPTPARTWPTPARTWSKLALLSSKFVCLSRKPALCWLRPVQLRSMSAQILCE